MTAVNLGYHGTEEMASAWPRGYEAVRAHLGAESFPTQGLMVSLDELFSTPQSKEIAGRGDLIRVIRGKFT
jgi:hypothetical protein